MVGSCSSTGRCCLLLLSHFSRVRLCATPEMAAHQAPPSLGFSRQEHWHGLPFPSPMRGSEKWKWSCSVMSELSDPRDGSPPGSSIHGIFQARVVEWVAIAFSFALIVNAKSSVIFNRVFPENTKLRGNPKRQLYGNGIWKHSSIWELRSVLQRLSTQLSHPNLSD